MEGRRAKLATASIHRGVVGARAFEWQLAGRERAVVLGHRVDEHLWTSPSTPVQNSPVFVNR